LKLLGDFPGKADGMNLEDLKKELVKAERTNCQTQKDKEADPKITEAKKEVKEASKDYDEIIKENQAMVKYIVHVIEERGTP
jgi:hypothetical protein